jgi:hypothetical protein
MSLIGKTGALYSDRQQMNPAKRRKHTKKRRNHAKKGRKHPEKINDTKKTHT